MEESRAGLNGYLAEAIKERRVNRGTDFISTLIEAEEKGEQLSTAEIIAVCQLLLLAGNITTTDLVGNAILALLRHPEELAKMRSRPELIRDVIEEVLRCTCRGADRNFFVL